MSPPQRCIVCHIVPFRCLRLANGARLLRCPRCQSGWWAWPAFEPAAFYNRDYFQSDSASRGYDDYASLEPGQRQAARERLRRIAQLGTQGRSSDGKKRRLLDVGCGTGTFLAEAGRAGWEALGIEVSEYAAAAARRQGHRVTRGPIEEVRLEAASFECITLWDVLEHLRDPLGVLTSAATALRPGGILALSTGDVTSLCARLSGPRWHLFNVPEHLFFFSPRCLRELLRLAGCRVARVTREVNWLPVAYLLERLRKSLGRQSQRRGAPRPGWVVPATLFDVLGVYAVRTPTAGSS